MKKEMDLKGKTALVVGLGISGVSAAKLLFRLGAEVLLTDSKGEEKLSDTLAELGSVIQYKFISDANQAALMSDLIVVSPGVPLSLPFLVQAAERNIRLSANWNWPIPAGHHYRHHRHQRKNHNTASWAKS